MSKVVNYITRIVGLLILGTVLMLIYTVNGHAQGDVTISFDTDNCASPPQSGTYSPSGTTNGKPRYVKDADHYVQWSGSRWEMYSNNSFGNTVTHYNTTNTTKLPCGDWEASFGCFLPDVTGDCIPPNSEPTTVGSIPDVSVTENAPNTTINLENYFDDAEDGASGLTYTNQTSDPSYFSTSIDGSNQLIIDYATSGTGGPTTVTIRGTDTNGAYVEQSFSVTVNSPGVGGTLVSESFADATGGATTFQDAGTCHSFNLTGTYDIEEFASYGHGGDDRYIGNANNCPSGSGVLGSIVSTAGDFYVRNLWVFPSEDCTNLGNNGSATIYGKNGGSVQYTITVTSGEFNTSYSVENGFTHINFENYSSAHTVAVDELEIETSGSIKYLAIDDFVYETFSDCNPNTAPVASNITFSGTLEVGETLTGSYDYSDSDGDPESGSTYKWYRSDDASGTNKSAISGATSQTYTLQSADETKYISFEVTPSDGTDAGTPVESDKQGAITDPAPEINVTGNGVTISDGDNTPSTTDHTDFGSASVSNGTVSRTFTIENTGDLNLTLIDDSGRGFVTVSGTHASDFTITSQPDETIAPAGSTTFTITFDPSATGDRTATVNISNDDGDENPYDFSIKGAGTNADPVITSTGTVEVDENNTAVQTVTATDDDGDTPSFSISGGIDATLFSINSSTGDLVFDTAPDFENPGDDNTDNVYDVEVTASDGNGGTDTQTISVTVNDLNDESPVITSSNTADVDENTTAVLTVTATDADDGSSVSYSITGGDDQSLFNINSSTGALAFGSAPDFENPADANSDNDYVVQVTASDGSNTTNQTITVSVINKNDNTPVITSSDAVSNDENDVSAVTVTATDADAGSSITYSISGGVDQNLFSINGSTGALTFDSAPDFENPGDSDTNNEYIVQVTASDGTNTTDQTITVTVNDLNDESPVITSSNTANVDENNTTVMTVTATDADAGTTITYSITGGNDQGAFNLNSTSGALSFGSAPDYENPGDANTDNEYIVQVTASDGTNTTDQTITVTVNDVNDESPVITSSNTASVDENNTTVMTVTATDADAGTTITYSITGGDDQGAFSLNSTSGALSFVSAPDYENPEDANTDNEYIVQVTASDGTNTTDQTITVTVNDINDNNPVITSSNTASVDENNTTVMTVTATDADAGTTITYSITGGDDQGTFSLNSTSGALSFGSAPDYENPGDANTDNEYIVQVTASDGTNTTDQTITVKVNDLNDESPVITSSNAVSVDENNTTVMTVTATDADAGTTITYSITGGDDQDAFSLNSTSGALNFSSAPDFENPEDANTDNEYIVQVTASDGTNITDQTITVAVNDVNDNSPVFQSTPYSADIAEDASTGTSVFTVNATDADDGVNAQIAYSITGGNTNGDFTIDTNTGEITTVNSLDRNTTPSYSLEVTATDQGTGNNMDVATVSITVTDVNDNAPVIQNEPYSASLNEDVATGEAVATITATDADEGMNAEVEYSITNGNTEGKFTIDGNTGAITIAQTLDYETTQSYTIEVTASDKGTPTLSDATTVSVTVNDVNDNAPAFQGTPYETSIAEDVATGTSVFTVSATDDDSGVNGQVSYSITNGNLFSRFDIDSNTGEIITAGSLDRENIASYTLEVTAVDQGTPALSQTITVNVTITDVNDNGPKFTNNPYSTSIAEDASTGTAVFTVTAEDADEPQHSNFLFSITDGNTGDAFAIDANTGEITVNGSLNRETLDSYELLVKAEDQGGMNISQSTTITISVTDVNDNAPVAADEAYETDEDTELQVAASGVLENDTDEDLDNNLTAVVVNEPSNGTLALNEDGSFTYTPEANYNGSDSFTYQANDGQHASNTATVNITVNAVNDAPTITTPSDAEIAINTSTDAIAFTIGDKDHALSALNVKAVADDNTLQPGSGIELSGSGADRSITLTPETDETGTTKVTLTISDGDKQATSTFTLTVYPVNVAPTDIALSNNSFIESIGLGEGIGTFSTTDENADDNHVYDLVAGDGDEHNHMFAIEEGELITDAAYDYETDSILSIRVRTTDRWEATFEKTFTLTLQANPKLELNIPTAFTPDNDGQNDTWEIDNISLHSNAVVKVFNRNGHTLFSSVGYEKSWDGTHNGKELPFGTYYFIIDLNDEASRTYKGTVMIIR